MYEKLKLPLLVITLFATLALSACNGADSFSAGDVGSTAGGTNDSTSTGLAELQGNFEDEPVIGIAYATQNPDSLVVSTVGFTGQNGEFTYNANDTIIFKFGGAQGILLGEVLTQYAVTPYDLVNAVTTSDQAAINMRKFLAAVNDHTVPDRINPYQTALLNAGIESPVLNFTLDPTAFESALLSLLKILLPTFDVAFHSVGATCLPDTLYKTCLEVETNAEAQTALEATQYRLFSGLYSGTYTGTYGDGVTPTSGIAAFLIDREQGIWGFAIGAEFFIINANNSSTSLDSNGNIIITANDPAEGFGMKVTIDTYGTFTGSWTQTWTQNSTQVTASGTIEGGRFNLTTPGNLGTLLVDNGVAQNPSTEYQGTYVGCLGSDLAVPCTTSDSGSIIMDVDPNGNIIGTTQSSNNTFGDDSVLVGIVESVGTTSVTFIGFTFDTDETGDASGIAVSAITGTIDWSTGTPIIYGDWTSVFVENFLDDYELGTFDLTRIGLGS